MRRLSAASSSRTSTSAPVPKQGRGAYRGVWGGTRHTSVLCKINILPKYPSRKSPPHSWAGGPPSSPFGRVTSLAGRAEVSRVDMGDHRGLNLFDFEPALPRDDARQIGVALVLLVRVRGARFPRLFAKVEYQAVDLAVAEACIEGVAASKSSRRETGDPMANLHPVAILNYKKADPGIPHVSLSQRNLV